MMLDTSSRYLVAVMLAAVVVALATAGVLSHQTCLGSACERVPAEGSSSVVVRDSGPSALRIHGRIQRPLSPGVSERLNLVLVNRNPFPVVASRFQVRPGLVSAPRATNRRNCTAHDFRVVTARAGLSVGVPPNDHTTLFQARVPRADWPRIKMLNRRTNQDGCKGARLTLRFTATVRQAGP